MNTIETISPSTHKELMNFVFVNRSEETAINPLTINELAEAQAKHKMLTKLTFLKTYKPHLIEDFQVLCKDSKFVFTWEIQQHAVEWHHHYLQQPGTAHLEETLCAAMYWKGLQHSV